MGAQFTGSLDITGSINLTGAITSAPVELLMTQGTASVSGFEGNLFVMDCLQSNEFHLQLTTASLAVLDPINITPGQDITLRVTQVTSSGELAAIIPVGNLQFNTNIAVPNSLGRYIASKDAVSQVDVIKFTTFDTGSLEAYGYYKNQTEFPILEQEFMLATGGTVTESGSFKIHTFTTSGDFTVLFAGNASEVMVVGGGGGGGRQHGGGGGGGGLVYASGSIEFSSGIFPVVIGGGGAGGGDVATNGSNSTFNGYTAYGGGYGGRYGDGGIYASGSDGGSGGGGGGESPGQEGGEAIYAAFGNTGSDGGAGIGSPGNGGGGGGAGEVGDSTNSGSNAPSGGDGLEFNFTGTPAYYAGGGGGGAFTVSLGGLGGLGGGGKGGDQGNLPGQSGTTNTGGGGGGGSDFQPGGGNGGSGIVIIKYQFQAL
jgi:hypothetical protein